MAGELGFDGEELAFVAMVLPALNAIVERPRLFKAGPGPFARALGLSVDECAAVWQFVTGAGCVQDRGRRGLKVDFDCLRSLAVALRQEARRGGAVL